MTLAYGLITATRIHKTHDEVNNTLELRIRPIWGYATSNGEVWTSPHLDGPALEFVEQHELKHIRAFDTGASHPNCVEDSKKLRALMDNPYPYY